MSTHPGMLLGYLDDGSVVATIDYMVRYDNTPERRPLGLVDFSAHEEAGGEATDIAVFDSGDPANPVKGAKVWPEYLGGQVHSFRVELTGPPGNKRIKALVHKDSGYRRERAPIENAIQARIAAADGRPADISDIVGGPDRPITLDFGGRTLPQVAQQVPDLPIARTRQ